MKEVVRFLRHVRMGYLLFISLLIVGAFFGAFEIIYEVLLTDTSAETLRWLYFSRSILLSLTLVVWAAWTVYNYREYYEDQLEAAKHRYRDIIEHSADAIIAMNNDRIITSWNRGAEEMLGWNRGEIIGKNVSKIVPAELLEKQEIETLNQEIKDRGHVRNYETERLTRSGEKKLVNLTESYIRNERDEIVGYSQILRDLTDVKLREEQIQQSERLATIGHMAAGVAHEVGNPLSAISSLVQLCQRKTDDPFIQEQLASVREHIQRITKIVRDLVDFSRPSSLQSEMVQLNEIITSAVGLLKHDARCRDVEFILDLDPGLPKLKCIPDQIHQVLVNLLLNSVDAMKDMDEPEVTVTTGKKNGWIELKIADIGKGIKEEHKSHIFEPFFTTKEVGSGTGLGLAVSHGIVNKLGGVIYLDSEENEGAVFSIKLPTDTEI